MLLEGKKLLITGVLTPQSIAFAAAKSSNSDGDGSMDSSTRSPSRPKMLWEAIS